MPSVHVHLHAHLPYKEGRWQGAVKETPRPSQGQAKPRVKSNKRQEGGVLRRWEAGGRARGAVLLQSQGQQHKTSMAFSQSPRRQPTQRGSGQVKPSQGQVKSSQALTFSEPESTAHTHRVPSADATSSGASGGAMCRRKSRASTAGGAWCSIAAAAPCQRMIGDQGW
jgi:hypothetical protein